MTTRRLIAAALVLFAAGAAYYTLFRHRRTPTPAPQQAYADPATCAQCHANEAAGYARTGMAHAFYAPTPQTTVLSPAKDRQYFHPASATFYELTQHDGSFYQHRWQQGFDGKPDNDEELRIDSIMGSGNHVRTYLHQEQDGTLIELPLAWYSESGGHFALNPGFDNPRPPTRRAIAYECIFCHNAYPRIPPTGHRDLSASPVYQYPLPTGIDCQRCHGPGAAHVKAAQTPGTSLEKIRAQVLNPARLANDRQMEVCEQCHLETTSRNLPDRIRHFDRGPFSYNPTEPLSAFNAYFTRDPAHGPTNNFEIVNSPYRLRQSQCYLKSQGALTCETCHNPHDLHKGPGAVTYYANICMRCHAAALPQQIAQHKHPASNDCIACHMPRRRTDDVVHAVMTDHLIQRFAPPASQLLAEKQELPDTPATAYHGPVARYLLDHQTLTPDDALYDDAAQVIDRSNLDAGIPALTKLLAQQQPSQPGVYIELGDARRHNGDLPGAIDSYRQALKFDPLSSRAQRRLGVALGSDGQTGEALSVLRTALEREPANALDLYEQALIELRTGDTQRAIAGLRQTLQLKPGFADAQNSLGSALAQAGDLSSAEAAFRAALAIDPYDSATCANLGRLLASRQDLQQAAFQLQRAVHLDASNAQAHQDYAIVLLQLHRTAQAQSEARAYVTANATSPRAHDFLGKLLLQQNSLAPAAAEFQAALALDPSFAPAQLDLAGTLIQQGKLLSAVPLLQRAARSSTPAIATQAAEVLSHLQPH